MPETKKRYARSSTRIGDAAALKERIAAGQASPRQMHEYERIIREFRRK